MNTAQTNTEVLDTLKRHIGMGMEVDTSEDDTAAIQLRISQIEAEFSAMLQRVSSEGGIDSFDDAQAEQLMVEKQRLNQRLEQCAEARQKRENARSRLEEIFMVLDTIRNRPMTFDNELVRKLLEGVVVVDKHTIKVVLLGGMEIVQRVE